MLIADLKAGMCNAFGGHKEDGSSFTYRDFFSDPKSEMDELSESRALIFKASLYASRHNANRKRRAHN